MNESLIKDIGRSYIVSSFLPATFFVLLAVAIFRGFAPAFLVANLQTGEQSTVYGTGILLLSFIFWVAFALYSSVDFIVKLFEGYYFPFFIAIPLRYIQYILQTIRLRNYRSYEKESEEIARLKKKTDRYERWALLEEKVPIIKAELQPGGMVGPLDNNWRLFLPTRLGNILRASEIYPVERYSLHAPELFNKLSVLLPTEFQLAFEEKDNQLDFILNSSLLAYIIGFLSLLAGLIGRSSLFAKLINSSDAPKNFLERGFSLISADEYVLLGIGFVLAGYLIYCLSINVVIEYSMFVRTSFDLYRFRLLRELNHPVPESLDEERNVWDAISDFFIAGERLGEVNFTYQLKTEFSIPASIPAATSIRANRKSKRKHTH